MQKTDNIETLYPQGETQIKASPAIGVLRVLLAVIWWIVWPFLIIFTLILLYALIALFGVESAQNAFEAITPLTAVVSLASVIVIAGVFLIIVAQLRQICKTLMTGDPFVPSNARRLRVIWIAVVGGELLRLVSTFFIARVSKDNADMSEMSADLRIYVWFMVLALIILAEVFQEGARLRLEQKLTV